MPGIDHVILNCSNFDECRRFYKWLMPLLGYRDISDPGDWSGWYFTDTQSGRTAGAFWIRPASNATPQTFDKHCIGLAEVAFQGSSRFVIEEIHRGLETHGGSVPDAPREYPYEPGYFALFFSDPSGIKLEVVTRLPK